MTRAHPTGPEVNGGASPGFADQAGDARRQGRCTRVAGLEAVKGAGEVTRQARLIDLVMAQESLDVGVLCLTQLEQQVLDIHVVVRPRQA